jgi:L-ascorbate metabolism protein UlaG (beta-lactamase superfamily)
MQVEWYGQSAFRLQDGETVVAIDPFGEMAGLDERGMRFDYPPITGLEANLLLVTHEHRDHNAVERVGGDPVVLRSTAGTFDSPVGEVVAVASEHDPVAGTQRGANTLVTFSLGGVRVAHLGDLGQAALRDEQAAALGRVDLLFVPVGDGPTIGAPLAAQIAARLQARWIVPMHYRTARTSFLEPADAFLQQYERVARLEGSSFALDELPGGEGDGPLVVVPAAP